jgi:hypothetical protein
MKYFQITDSNVVVGYNLDDIDGIAFAISNGWQEVTNTFIP